MDLDFITQWAKQKGFVFQSSDIYGGFGGVYDYGPLGVELMKNIKNEWWLDMVQKRTDIVGLDSGIMMDPRVWKASGHVDGFSDPFVVDNKTSKRYRADHLLNEIGVDVDEKTPKDEFEKIFKENKDKLKISGDWSDIMFFNLLVESNLGDFSAKNDNPTYLRGETCQGIYVNFNNVLNSVNKKLPFGIAQIGKAFRNEISSRQFIFRTREFEQMEMQYFTHGNNAENIYEEFKKYRLESLIRLGLDENKLRFKDHTNLVFYAKAAVDIEYEFPFGFSEIEGVHNRGTYDLTKHQEHSKTNLEYFDQEANEKFIPTIVETSCGSGRLFLALLFDSLKNETLKDGSERLVLKIKKSLAPYKTSVLPLSKDKDLIKIAKDIHSTLSNEFMCSYDETQSIGKRYRRADEVGTPYCVTVDFESIEDGKVTVRDRDTMLQERVNIKEIKNYIISKLSLDD